MILERGWMIKPLHVCSEKVCRKFSPAQPLVKILVVGCHYLLECVEISWRSASCSTCTNTICEISQAHMCWQKLHRANYSWQGGISEEQQGWNSHSITFLPVQCDSVVERDKEKWCFADKWSFQSVQFSFGCLILVSILCCINNIDTKYTQASLEGRSVSLQGIGEIRFYVIWAPNPIQHTRQLYP